MHRWNVAQLVRLPNKTKRSWVQPPTFHRVYDIILPLRSPPGTRGWLMWVSLMKIASGIQSIL